MKTRTIVNATLETRAMAANTSECIGAMTIDGALFSVVEHRTFDDFGVNTESFKVVNFSGETRVLHSDDDALTFWEN